MDVHAYARQLLDARGVAAIAEAAQKARAFADQGDGARAETWRRIQAALLIARGPGQADVGQEP
jgi:hypothetical protein